MPIRTCIFDAYGTLFDVAAAARQAAQEPGFSILSDRWEAVARDWRSKQLQYTWLRAVTGAHADFWQVTQDGLDWALEAAGLDDTRLRMRLLDLYWELQAYPEVPGMLAELKAAGKATAILSNGSPGMLKGAVASAGLVSSMVVHDEQGESGNHRVREHRHRSPDQDQAALRHPGGRCDGRHRSNVRWPRSRPTHGCGDHP